MTGGVKQENPNQVGDQPGLYRPCGLTYDLGNDGPQKCGIYDQDATEKWTLGWEKMAWHSEEAVHQFPFTGHGWTLNWLGYKKFVEGGCKDSDKHLYVGSTEIVAAEKTNVKCTGTFSPFDYACGICKEGDCGSHSQPWWSDCQKNILI